MRTGEPLPAVEDVLAALATGLWHWDTADKLVIVDAEAARLLGLPAASATLTEAQTRARLHPADWNEITAVVQLAVAEGTLAEVRVRITSIVNTSACLHSVLSDLANECGHFDGANRVWQARDRIAVAANAVAAAHVTAGGNETYMR